MIYLRLQPILFCLYVVLVGTCRNKAWRRTGRRPAGTRERGGPRGRKGEGGYLTIFVMIKSRV